MHLLSAHFRVCKGDQFPTESGQHAVSHKKGLGVRTNPLARRTLPRTAGPSLLK